MPFPANVTCSVSSPKEPYKPVLVVDDEDYVCSLMREQLRRAGFDVKVARTRAEALHLLESEEISLLMLDWYLGRHGTEGAVTGRAVLDKCRKLYPAAPIVVISGMPGMGINVRDEVLRIDADSFLEKPIDRSVMIEHIRKLLNRASLKVGQFRLQREDEIIPMDTFRNSYVKSVVAFLGGNVSRAAGMLGMHRHTVTSILEG